MKRTTKKKLLNKRALSVEHKCGDCGRKTGEYHMDMCDVERCPKCGNQLMSCDCFKKVTKDRKHFIDAKGKLWKRIKVKTTVEEDFGDDKQVEWGKR